MPCHHHYFSFTKPKGDGNLQSAGTDCARVGRYGIILIGMCYENIANDKKKSSIYLVPNPFNHNPNSVIHISFAIQGACLAKQFDSDPTL